MLPAGGGPSVSADRTGVAIGLPGHGQGPRGPGLPHGHPGGGDAAPGPGRGGLQGADDPAGGMRRAHVGPGGEPPAVPRGVQGPHGPHWRPGGPGGGEGQLALQHEAVVGRCSPRLSGPLHLPQARLHQRHDQADGPGPLRPWVADGPDIRPNGGEGDEGIVYPPITADNVHGYRKKNYPVEMKHVFWAHMECGLVLSSVTPWASIVRGTGVPGEGTPASSRSGPARPSCSWCWTSRRRASTTAG